MKEKKKERGRKRRGWRRMCRFIISAAVALLNSRPNQPTNQASHKIVVYCPKSFVCIFIYLLFLFLFFFPIGALSETKMKRKKKE